MGGEDWRRKRARDPAKPDPRRRRQHQRTRSPTTTTIAQSDLPSPSATGSRRDAHISSYPLRKEELKELKVKRRPGASSLSHISSPALQRVRALLETRPHKGTAQQQRQRQRQQQQQQRPQQQSRLCAPPRRCSTSPLKVSSECLEVSSSRALTLGLRRPKLLPPVPAPVPSRDFFAEWAGLDDIDWEPLMQISSPAEKFAVPLVFTACAEDHDTEEDEDEDEAPSPSARASTIDLGRQDFAIEVVGDERIDMARRGFKGESFGVGGDQDGEDGGDDTELLLREQLQAGVAADDGQVSRSSRPKKRSSTRARSKRLKRARRWSGAGAEAGVTVGPQVGALRSEVVNEEGEEEGEEKEEGEEEKAEVEAEDGEEEEKYTVDKILGKRKFKGRDHYLVKWKGYAEVRDRTWEPCDRLGDDVPDVVREYEGRRLRLRQKRLRRRK
ncbi:uncharacterized protein L3040_007276 [Drepanopeziza brunnea f. sp. 'multigermtubi']|uniref:uncharacterized protein n=1 Tax=Drepanopeziza brunnea f. sp. 'multigermtubi' TaxID=698441 RepID=UPI00239DE41E|nr:hypothetical protein L3040_007276 [Drepanopeziza brunnea f. sp. 'multigermtubi']